MRNRFYALVLTPLLFGACTSSQVTSSPAPIAVAKSSGVVSKMENVQTVVVEGTADNSSNGVRYIVKPIVIEQGMLHIKGFMGTLKPTLKSALAQDKTQETAMGACSTMAMQMTDDYNAVTTDTKVRRTALKYRNPKNRPDATDKEVMYRLQAVNDGKPVAVDMGDKYRVYKPLKMKHSCLACHGDKSQISPKVQKLIQAKYPHDMATGFRLGEFRGAVVAEIQK
jgi:hypothetical protein